MRYRDIFESREPGEFVYHASYLPDLSLGLKSILNNGLLPSKYGYSGPGLYFAYEPSGTYYHVEKNDAIMFRVKWEILVSLYGVYPKNTNGIQRDNNEIIVPGPVPAKYLEVEFFEDEWWDIVSACRTALREK
jgi:hypothetical protein